MFKKIIEKFTAAPKSAIVPNIHPDTVTLHGLRAQLKADVKALSGNPIAKEVVLRYFDMAFNVTDDGEAGAPIEPATSFRDRVNELTVGHLSQVKRRRDRQRNRTARKEQEKARKQTEQRRYNSSQPRNRNGHQPGQRTS